MFINNEDSKEQSIIANINITFLVINIYFNFILKPTTII